MFTENDDPEAVANAQALEEKENEALLNISLILTEVPVKMKGKEGVEVEYTLREMDGAGRDAYLNGVTARMQTNDEGKVVKVKNFEGMNADLISRCLYDVEDKRVPIKVIQTWPSSVQKILYAKAQKINGLGKDAEEKAKND